MAKYYWSTVDDFIQNGKLTRAKTDDLVEFEGFNNSSDGYTIYFHKTGAMGVASQTPIERNDNSLTDALGYVWEPTRASTAYYDGVNLNFPAPFGSDGAGIYTFIGTGWQFVDQPIPTQRTTSDLINATGTFENDVENTTGFYTAGDSGGAQWKATSTTGLTPSQTPADRGAAELVDGSGRLWTLSIDKLLNFGALGAVVSATDCTGAINAGLNYIRSIDGKLDDYGFEIVPQGVSTPSGVLVCLGSINATNIRGLSFEWDGRGTVIRSKAVGKVALDMLGSRAMTIQGLQIYGDETDAPLCGFQYGRIGVPEYSCDNHKFINCKTNGKFTIAAVYSLASETQSHYHPEYWNYDTSATSYVYVNDGLNSFPGLPVSDFVDATAIAADTPMSNIQHTFFSADIRKQAGGPAIWFSKSNQVKFYNSYAVSQDDVVFTFQSDANQLNDVYIDCHHETTGSSSCVKFENHSSVSGNELRVRGFTFIDHAPFCSDEVFLIDSSVSKLKLMDANIDIARTGQTVTNKMCNDASKLDIVGSLYSINTLIESFRLYGSLTTDTFAAVTSFPSGNYSITDSLGNNFTKGSQSFSSSSSSTPGPVGVNLLKVQVEDGTVSMTPLAVAPSVLRAGMLAVDDGSDWSGVNATGTNRVVQYTGAGWVLL